MKGCDSRTGISNDNEFIHETKRKMSFHSKFGTFTLGPFLSKQKSCYSNKPVSESSGISSTEWFVIFDGENGLLSVELVHSSGLVGGRWGKFSRDNGTPGVGVSMTDGNFPLDAKTANHEWNRLNRFWLAICPTDNINAEKFAEKCWLDFDAMQLEERTEEWWVSAPTWGPTLIKIKLLIENWLSQTQIKTA